MSLTGTDSGNALGAGDRRFDRSLANSMAADDVWASQKCIEFGIMPNVLNKLFMLIARDKRGVRFTD